MPLSQPATYDPTAYQRKTPAEMIAWAFLVSADKATIIAAAQGIEDLYMHSIPHNPHAAKVRDWLLNCAEAAGTDRIGEVYEKHPME